MERKILVASTNPGKVAELSAMLDADIEWLNLSDFEQIDKVEEDGLTFAENARKKAVGYAKAADCWTIADDSGLIVDALDGAPGVKSARFSSDKSETNDRKLLDHKNMAKVLKLLEGVPKEARTARFVCALCLASPPDERRASPEKILIETEGTLQGLIAEDEKGRNGFGYDPIFFVPYLNKTVAQLTAEQKNAVSHRGSAIRKLKSQLKQLLKNV